MTAVTHLYMRSASNV